MAGAANRNSSSEGGSSISSSKRGTMGALPQIAFNYDVRRASESVTLVLPTWQLHALAGAHMPRTQAAKAGVQKGFDASTTAQFRRFFASPLFDRLARACIQHFLARFEHDLLCKAS